MATRRAVTLVPVNGVALVGLYIIIGQIFLMDGKRQPLCGRGFSFLKIDTQCIVVRFSAKSIHKFEL